MFDPRLRGCLWWVGLIGAGVALGVAGGGLVALFLVEALRINWYHGDARGEWLVFGLGGAGALGGGALGAVLAGRRLRAHR